MCSSASFHASGSRPARRSGRVAEEAAWWRSYLPSHWEQAGRPFERRLLDAALDALSVLPGTQGDQVLVNQDLHGDNVLSARREPWLLIDPKPLLAEREFALAPIIRSAELGHSRKAVLRRLDRLSAEPRARPRARAPVDARLHDRLGHRRSAIPRRNRPLALLSSDEGSDPFKII